MTSWPNGTATKPATSDDYGWRVHPITGQLVFHYGWDSVGYPLNCAVKAGSVTYAGYNGGAGNQINVDHGASAGFRSVYKHNDSFLVGVGSAVAERQPLGVQGTTGASTGKHLHLEIVLSFSGETIDPVPFLSLAVAATPTTPFPTPASDKGESKMTNRLIFKGFKPGTQNVGDYGVWIDGVIFDTFTGAQGDANAYVEKNGATIDLRQMGMTFDQFKATVAAQRGDIAVGDITVPADPALLAELKANTKATLDLLAATKKLNPPD